MHNDSYELIMQTGYQRGDKETLKKKSRNAEDFCAGLSCADLGIARQWNMPAAC
jgi:hypothetical protein